LYVFSGGATSSYIGTLGENDGGAEEGQLGDWASAPSSRGAEASLNGRYLAFGSTKELTGYGNHGPCEERNTSGEEYELFDAPCAEVFLYDLDTGELICASCNPTGEAPRGNSTLRRIAGERPWQPQPRYLTDQGRLFFDSGDRLSSRDTNGAVEDVYESEPAAVGSCTGLPRCVSLISTGSGSVDSNFLAMDETGANVFFTTRDRLVPADADELIDLYDAREGGGFPAESEGAPAPCQGEACQSAEVPPATGAPGTQNFSGSGNPSWAVPKCRKGHVKKGRTCVKKVHKKKAKAKGGHRRHPRPGHERGRSR
jgi:hypothetical protein